MLILTQQAAQMIEKLATEAKLPSGAGLRIARRRDSPGLSMALAAQPRGEDQVLVHGQVTVFLDPAATRRLREETLDARSTQIGSAFFLRP